MGMDPAVHIWHLENHSRQRLKFLQQKQTFEPPPFCELEIVASWLGLGDVSKKVRVVEQCGDNIRLADLQKGDAAERSSHFNFGMRCFKNSSYCNMSCTSESLLGLPRERSSMNVNGFFQTLPPTPPQPPFQPPQVTKKPFEKPR